VDAIFTEIPFYGSREMVHEIQRRTSWSVHRKRVRRIMRKLGRAGSSRAMEEYQQAAPESQEIAIPATRGPRLQGEPGLG
ncbi:MAG TPA: transposase, partial [Fibrobacteraceae bacterium]|nr:transposase [Fibrobacteraceae bacterium]